LFLCHFYAVLCVGFLVFAEKLLINKLNCVKITNIGGEFLYIG